MQSVARYMKGVDPLDQLEADRLQRVGWRRHYLHYCDVDLGPDSADREHRKGKMRIVDKPGEELIAASGKDGLSE
jgi:hypothetical protein